jgi:predicted phosphodiesterase
MKRRHFIGSLTVGGLGTAFADQAEFTDKTFLVTTPLSVMAPRLDGFEAVWGVSRLSRGWLEWELEDGLKGKAKAGAFGFTPQGDDVLRVRLDGMNSKVRGRVRSHTIAVDDGEKVISPWKSFHTLNSKATNTRFVMWNDTHIHDETIQALHKATPAADFMVWNGDTCNDWTRDDLLTPTLLNPGNCDITVNRPLFITWGNHDSRGAHAFRMPGVVATPEGRPFYAFRSGPVAVICLHTGEDKPDDHPSFQGRVAFDTLRLEQAEWLANVIRQPGFRDAPYRVVFCHIPLRWRDERPQDYLKSGFDRHSGRSRTAWHDSLVAWKTQVILSGHTHQSHWMPPTEEFPYGQLTGGGPKLHQATWTEGRADGSLLSLKVNKLDGDILHDIQIRPIA